MIFVSLYLIVGALCVIGNATMVTKAIPNPEDLNSVVSTGLRFVLTWPWWAFKK